LRPLTRSDIPLVSKVERAEFATTWPRTDFHGELSNPLAYYLVTAGYSKGDSKPRRIWTERPISGLAKGVIGLFSKIIKKMATMKPYTEIPGYIGIWFMGEQAHIVSIAIGESYQGNGLGELLLIGCVELAYHRRCEAITLEVRISNKRAQKLYLKYGFQITGIRKAYYRDNNEDAYIMTTDPIATQPYRDRFMELVKMHEKLWGISERTLG